MVEEGVDKTGNTEQELWRSVNIRLFDMQQNSPLIKKVIRAKIDQYIMQTDGYNDNNNIYFIFVIKQY